MPGTTTNGVTSVVWATSLECWFSNYLTMGSQHNTMVGYITVTLAYWAFMLTDGALRMLVLLHFYTLGFSAILLAYLFLVYELMGVLTNLVAGWLGARYGVYALLFAGLGLQIIALASLSLFAEIDANFWSVVFVMAIQSLSGIAKDLTKTGSKSAIKFLTVGNNESHLFRWVAALTGSKNAIKGLGFFIGAGLLAWFGFSESLWVLASLLMLVFAGVCVAPRPSLGRLKRNVPFREVLSSSRSVNRLSAARLFLFSARDTWFVVALPLFLHSTVARYFSVSHEQAFYVVGTFLAIWVIAYGVVQALAPKYLARDRDSVQHSKSAVQWSTGWVTLVLVALTVVMFVFAAENPQQGNLFPAFILIIGLMAFGVVFALSSSLHSYLILAFTSESRATMDVGFYYMANAAGRLLGTLLSGISYQFGGIAVCLLVASTVAAASYLLTKRL